MQGIHNCSSYYKWSHKVMRGLCSLLSMISVCGLTRVEWCNESVAKFQLASALLILFKVKNLTTSLSSPLSTNLVFWHERQACILSFEINHSCVLTRPTLCVKIGITITLCVVANVKLLLCINRVSTETNRVFLYDTWTCCLLWQN